jgi:hypothetical protein
MPSAEKGLCESVRWRLALCLRPRLPQQKKHKSNQTNQVTNKSHETNRSKKAITTKRRRRRRRRRHHHHQLHDQTINAPAGKATLIFVQFLKQETDRGAVGSQCAGELPATVWTDRKAKRFGPDDLVRPVLPAKPVAQHCCVHR